MSEHEDEGQEKEEEEREGVWVADEGRQSSKKVVESCWAT